MAEQAPETARGRIEYDAADPGFANFIDAGEFPWRIPVELLEHIAALEGALANAEQDAAAKLEAKDKDRRRIAEVANQQIKRANDAESNLDAIKAELEEGDRAYHAAAEEANIWKRRAEATDEMALDWAEKHATMKAERDEVRRVLADYMRSPHRDGHDGHHDGFCRRCADRYVEACDAQSSPLPESSYATMKVELEEGDRAYHAAAEEATIWKGRAATMKAQFDALQKEHDDFIREMNQRAREVSEERSQHLIHIATMKALAESLAELLRRMRQWDHLEGSADGPYWRIEIDRYLAAYEKQKGEQHGT